MRSPVEGTWVCCVAGAMTRTDFEFESRLVPLILAFARARGLDAQALAASCGLPPEAVATPAKALLTTRVSVPGQLMALVADQLQDVHAGLALSEFVPKGAYGVAEFLVRATPTLRPAFENLVRFNGLTAPSQTFRFEVEGGEGRLHNFCTQRPGSLGRHLAEYTTSLMRRTLGNMAPRVPVVRAWFITPRPPGLDRLREVFGSSTHFEFEQPTNGFAVPEEALTTPVVGGDEALGAFLEEHATAALASRPAVDDFIEKVRTQLRDAVRAGEPNVEHVAGRLALSSRTLQRRLTDLATSFQEVLDDVRFDLARAYLRDPRLDVGQVAFLLGYSELRAFDRAFRRWAEQSPSEWRAAQ